MLAVDRDYAIVQVHHVSGLHVACVGCARLLVDVAC
jgi:hypothetical protein